LKEKHEVDLKKEIKKLQRLRDQIKTWVSSSEVKDKDALVEARKLIETKMEQFKICEKETKTKTYSKEGLAREDKLDPAEESKLRTTGWIADYVDRFRVQVEEKEFDIEKLSSGKGKKTNKHQIEQLQLHIAHHKYHIGKLEGIVRLINNDVLEAEAVDALQEDLDYYLDSYQEEEYVQAYDQDFFYESLGLEELDLIQVDRLAQAQNAAKKSDDATETSSKESKEMKNGKKPATSSVIPLTIGRARSKAEKKADKEREDNEARLLAASTPVKKPAASPQNAPIAPVVVAPPPPPVLAGASMAAVLKRETEQQEKERQKVSRLGREAIFACFEVLPTVAYVYLTCMDRCPFTARAATTAATQTAARGASSARGSTGPTTTAATASRTRGPAATTATATRGSPLAASPTAASSSGSSRSTTSSRTIASAATSPATGSGRAKGADFAKSTASATTTASAAKSPTTTAAATTGSNRFDKCARHSHVRTG
jgi:CCR4-NOT transcriptional regulation complex NOT5 subunit